MRAAASVIAAISVLAYPLVVYYGLANGSARFAGVALLAVLVPVLVVRLWRASKETRLTVLALPLTVIALVGLSVMLNDRVFLLLLPTLINSAMLAQFGRTLFRGPPMVERFARLVEPDLSSEKVGYCRTVTQIWCAFFALNGATAMVLAMSASLQVWSFYTGIVNYVIMGALFAGEYFVRKVRFRTYSNAFHDRVFAALFPPP